jgi:hypothetical protein
MLWSGTADSAVDLNPTNLSGFTASSAANTDGTQQVGAAWGTVTSNHTHAMVWSGTADTAVDLNPTNLIGIVNSTANGNCGNQQVGRGDGPGTGNSDHAMLWIGTADSAVDLNPSNLGITTSVVRATNGVEQVGRGAVTETLEGTYYQALLWTGTAASAVDLQLSLPPVDTWLDSSAFAIDAAGNAFGWADGLNGTYAVEWSPVSPVPEPATGSILALPVVGMLMLRRHREPA